jgi:hypothetical protein
LPVSQQLGPAELKGSDGSNKEATAEDSAPLDKDTKVDELTEDDYFRKNAEVRMIMNVDTYSFSSESAVQGTMLPQGMFWPNQ